MARERQVKPTVASGGIGGGPRVKFIGDQRPQQTLLDRLRGVAELGSKVAVKELNEIAEADKIKQIDQLRKSQAPTDDATVAGYRAHALMKMNRTVKKQEAILKSKSATWEGTPIEWNAEVMKSKTEANEEMTKSNPLILQDQQFQKAQGLMFEDSYGSVAQSRVIDGLRIEHQDRLTEFGRSFIDVMNAPDTAEKYQDMDRLMNVYAPALQLSPKETIPIATSIMARDLNSGNLRMIGYGNSYKVDEEKGLTLFDVSPELQQAAENGRKISRNEYENELNVRLNGLLIKNQEIPMSTEAFVSELQDLKTYEDDHSDFDAKISRMITASKGKTDTRFAPFEQKVVLDTFFNKAKKGDKASAYDYLRSEIKKRPDVFGEGAFSNGLLRSALDKGDVIFNRFDDSGRDEVITANTRSKQLAREAVRRNTPEAIKAFDDYMEEVTSVLGVEDSTAMHKLSMSEAVRDFDDDIDAAKEARWISTVKPFYGRQLAELGTDFLGGKIDESGLAIGYNEIMKAKAKDGYASKEAWGLAKWESMLKQKNKSDEKLKFNVEWLNGLNNSQSLFGASPDYTGPEHDKGIKFLNKTVNDAIEKDLPGQDATDNKKNVFDVRYKHKLPALKKLIGNGLYDKDLKREFTMLSAQSLSYIDQNSRDFNLQTAPFDVVEKLRLYREMPIEYRNEFLKGSGEVKAFWNNMLSESASVQGGAMPEEIWRKAYVSSHGTADVSPRVESELRTLLPDVSGSDILDSGSFFQKTSLNESQEGYLEAKFADRANLEKNFGNNNTDAILEDSKAFMNSLYKHSDRGNIIEGDQANVSRVIFGQDAVVGQGNTSQAIDDYLTVLGRDGKDPEKYENAIVQVSEGGSITILNSRGVLIGNLEPDETLVIREAFLSEGKRRDKLTKKLSKFHTIGGQG